MISHLEESVAPAVVHRALMAECQAALKLVRRSIPALVSFDSRDELPAHWVSHSHEVDETP